MPLPCLVPSRDPWRFVFFEFSLPSSFAWHKDSPCRCVRTETLRATTRLVSCYCRFDTTGPLCIDVLKTNWFFAHWCAMLSGTEVAGPVVTRLSSIIFLLFDKTRDVLRHDFKNLLERSCYRPTIAVTPASLHSASLLSAFSR